MYNGPSHRVILLTMFRVFWSPPVCNSRGRHTHQSPHFLSVTERQREREMKTGKDRLVLEKCALPRGEQSRMGMRTTHLPQPILVTSALERGRLAFVLIFIEITLRVVTTVSLSSLQTLTTSSSMAGYGEDFSSFSGDTAAVTTVDPSDSHIDGQTTVVDPSDSQIDGQTNVVDSSDCQVDTQTTVVDSSNDDDLKYGFQRPEMFSTSLAGTVDPYQRHLFLCYKNAESWPANVETDESDPLPGRLAASLKSSRDKIHGKTRLTICEGPGGTDSSDGDILVFPEMIKYRGLTHLGVDTFVEDVLVTNTNWVSGSLEPLEGSYIFVCSHGSRDRRCGVCGPALIEKFKEEIELCGMKDRVFVSACSHVGGHKYAGNLIIFSPNSEGKVTGNWYGYVTPDDVPILLDQHIGKGVIIEKLWRGQMVASSEVEDKVNEPKLQEKDEKEPKGSTEGDMMKDAGSCCQGANGFSCCRDERVEAKAKDVEKTAEVIKTKALDRVSAWMGNWEQSEVLAAAAVVGAVASIAVAYSIYRRSG
ncbi:Sucraseferredoxin-like [Macleaya cordata]|uniref:Sucraseferredoxin-like n=1 Tax=Macleaya cordata TaxID=56857 RepID=A0A200RD36_MACCD|nr:Sucraseferredoxin-like [Macleaya cordata]